MELFDSEDEDGIGRFLNTIILPCFGPYFTRQII